MLKAWEELPEWLRVPEVRPYYDILAGKKASLVVKRAFDSAMAVALLILLTPVMLGIAVAIVADSPGGVFYRQVRVTAYGRKFRIHKFRTMVSGADQMGPQVTVGRDMRVTQVGGFLRRYRLDELPQLLDVLAGDMSFVGPRPEVPEYVRRYTKEMRATLLLPAGITSEASIRYKDEARLLDGAEDVDKVYVEDVLPMKMRYNLEGVKRFGFSREFWTMARTVLVVFGEGSRIV